jgi:hypothetical protein
MTHVVTYVRQSEGADGEVHVATYATTSTADDARKLLQCPSLRGLPIVVGCWDSIEFCSSSLSASDQILQPFLLIKRVRAHTCNYAVCKQAAAIAKYPKLPFVTNSS